MEKTNRWPERATELATGLIHGEAGLIGKSVALLTHDPDDIILARLLNCFGARVKLFGPPTPYPNGQPLAAALLEEVKQRRPDLDLRPLERWATHGMIADADLEWDTTPWQEWGNQEPLDIVIARGVVPADPAAAEAALLQLAPLVRLSGQLELLDLAEPALGRIQEQAGLLCFGLRIQAKRRLALIRLADPLHEYPVEGRDHPSILAHCQARLDYAANFVSGADVLEAGAATGIGARLFLERGARRVVCLDWSADALRLGCQTRPDPRIQFCRADLNRPLALADASFDTVVCLEVLEHIRAQPAAIAEFFRVLRPGGRLIVSIPDPQSESGWAAVNRFGNPYHLRTISREELLGWLADFEEVKLACQRELIGSMVTEEEAPQASGEFATVAGLNDGMAGVLLCVAIKPPVAQTLRHRPGPPRLRVHGNASAYLLSLYQHGRNLEDQLARERQQAWRQMTGCHFDASAARQRRLELGLRDLQRVGGVLVNNTRMARGAWEAATASVLRSSASQGRIRSNAPIYALTDEDCGWRLEPFFDELRLVESVFFPRPRDCITKAAVLRWLRVPVRELWFLESNGWQCVDAAEDVVCRMLSRTLKLVRGLRNAWREQWGPPPQANARKPAAQA